MASPPPPHPPKNTHTHTHTHNQFVGIPLFKKIIITIVLKKNVAPFLGGGAGSWTHAGSIQSSPRRAAAPPCPRHPARTPRRGLGARRRARLAGFLKAKTIAGIRMRNGMTFPEKNTAQLVGSFQGTTATGFIQSHSLTSNRDPYMKKN